MPEFVPEHTPSGLDAFTAAYLECAEWVLDEEVSRSTLRGFSRQAIKDAKADCRAFMAVADQTLGLAFGSHPSYDERQAGHDFWLTRNRHGAGFWDRGLGRLGDELTEMAKRFGEVDTYVSRGWIHFA